MNVKPLRTLAGLAVLAIAATGVMCAQQADTKSAGSAKKTTITGCLNKGQEADGYYLKDDSGKTWELTDSDAKVADQVGHRVTLTGVTTHESKSEESKIADAEKAEANGKHSGDFRVSSVKMVSESCQ